ncbi:MAG: 50S ribosomal protein L5 [Deltaproteobacteria bacterium]|nr:MAG: 50S ribosomal protein L5 [Deltaproteobacteria bacterium]
MPRIKHLYLSEIMRKIQEEIGVENEMRVPRLSKIVLSIGVGEAISNSKSLDYCKEILSSISGQKPIIAKAKKSIAVFKLRKGAEIGVFVTLRRNRMWEFFDRFINIALPRVKDFRGISSKFDGSGNLSIGLKECIVFPEVDYNKIDKVRGLNISIITTARSDLEGKVLLKALGLPLRR